MQNQRLQNTPRNFGVAAQPFHNLIRQLQSDLHGIVSNVWRTGPIMYEE
jgi:hypothetical protein